MMAADPDSVPGEMAALHMMMTSPVDEMVAESRHTASPVTRADLIEAMRRRAADWDAAGDGIITVCGEQPEHD